MKSSVIPLVVVVTAFLICFVFMIQLNLAFDLMFYMMVAGQILIIYMVYRVLTDNYTTTRNFDDWYEDHPMNS
ncbi:hypothetical protein [Robertkochia solimangrovi]|uniref:hypothetical protein n=1 Tax=Robertkochia solimangrovi TaxID=2213046 RepID=UPI00117E8931|nr:hypothetical protein [Robertkochia solimangrovi]TRZ45252.1 hypothetical protein DMZ48_05760 [Robertkochia solimangrovi]